jgi:exodeoxyribonuclease VII large subunit
MSGSEEIPTLAELRRGRGRRLPRRQEAATAGPGLFDALPPAAILHEVEPVKQRAPENSRELIEEIETLATKKLAADAARVWSVGALVSEVRELVEARFVSVTVEGEISNWRPAASGHCYFTLKDDAGQLAMVMFRKQAGLVQFRAKDGDAVRVRGQLSVYENRGQMQMIVESMQPMGLGALLAAVRELKDRLRREGLFERKRPLPAFPRCIGVVTSVQGAALQDIVKVCRRRHAAVQLLIYPAAVQGPRCAVEVAAGVRWFSAHAEMVDVVMVARGGGSWEDLHGFDDERVARAIAGCAVPVIVGVGHATDSTIADAAADVCAPTPSAAAEIVTAAQHRVEERLERLRARLLRSGRYATLEARQRISRLGAEMVLRRVRDGLRQKQQRVDEMEFRAQAAAERRLRAAALKTERLETRLRQRDPGRRVAASVNTLAALQVRLQGAGRGLATIRTSTVERASARLEALNPLRVLERGYALVYAGDGKLLRSSEEVSEGEAIVARLARGELRATVTLKKM